MVISGISNNKTELEVSFYVDMKYNLKLEKVFKKKHSYGFILTLHSHDYYKYKIT